MSILGPCQIILARGLSVWCAFGIVVGVVEDMTIKKENPPDEDERVSLFKVCEIDLQTIFAKFGFIYVENSKNMAECVCGVVRQFDKCTILTQLY